MLTLADFRVWLDIATRSAGLVALIVGLVQLRTVRRSIELNTNLAIVQAEREVWAIVLRHPDAAPRLTQERWGDPARETLFAAILLDHYETLFFQRHRGAIGAAHWKGIEKAILTHMASPSIRTVWESIKDRYLDDFGRYVDRALARQAEKASQS